MTLVAPDRTERAVEPLSLANAPALIERILPAQKLSAEAQKERKAGAGQTLTALGSYWKGRKPLILARACVLGVAVHSCETPRCRLCGGGERRKLRRSDGRWGLVGVALDDPGLVVDLLEPVQRHAQLLDGVEAADPQQVLLEGPDEALDTAVALGLAHESRRARDAEEGELALVVVGDELTSVVVAELQAVAWNPAARIGDVDTASRAICPRAGPSAGCRRLGWWRARPGGSWSRPPPCQRAPGLQMLDLARQQLVGHGQVPDLGLEATNLGVAAVGGPRLQRRLAGSQEGVAPHAQLGRRHREFPRQQLQIFAPQQPQHRALLALGRHAPAPVRRWPVAASVMGARRRASAPYRRVRHAHLLALLH